MYILNAVINIEVRDDYCQN